VDRSGKIIGKHEGLAFYTIGQRKGLQIAGNEPYYVLQKDSDSNVLLAGFLQDLGRDHFKVNHINWISGNCDDKTKQYDVKIRYRAKPLQARTKYDPETGEMEITTRKELRDVTPGQFAVLYHGDTVIAAGEISL
jgi:tRNA-specific 2-thiouridylase